MRLSNILDFRLEQASVEYLRENDQPVRAYTVGEKSALQQLGLKRYGITGDARFWVPLADDIQVVRFDVGA